MAEPGRVTSNTLLPPIPPIIPLVNVVAIVASRIIGCDADNNSVAVRQYLVTVVSTSRLLLSNPLLRAQLMCPSKRVAVRRPSVTAQRDVEQ